MPATHTFIQTVTANAGAQASLGFAGIPQTYNDLYLVMSFRSTSATGVGGVGTAITINGLTTNRFGRRLWAGGAGPTVGSDNWTGSSLGANPPTAASQASIFGSVSVYFLNYSGATQKIWLVDSVSEGNSATAWESDMVAGRWAAANAITDISITMSDASNFAQYSSASLYGIKNS